MRGGPSCSEAGATRSSARSDLQLCPTSQEALPRERVRPWPITGRNQNGRPEPDRTETPRAPHEAHPATRTAAPAPAPPRANSQPLLPGRTNQHKGCRRPAGQAIRSRFPAWTGRRTKDGTRERALLGQALHRIDPTHPRRPRRGHLHRPYQHGRAIDPEATRLEAGRADPCRWRKRERSYGTEQTRS